LQIQLKFAQFSKLENWRIERETEVTGKGASTDNGKSLSRAKNRFMNLRKFTNYSVCQGLPLLNYKKRIDLIFGKNILESGVVLKYIPKHVKINIATQKKII